MWYQLSLAEIARKLDTNLEQGLSHQEAEKKLAKLIGTEEAFILPTITLIHIGVIPALVGKDGIIFKETF